MNSISTFTIGLLLIAATGCVNTHRIKVQPTPLSAVAAESKIPLSAALVLNEQFKTYAIHVKLAGGRTVVPIGGQLSASARDVCGQLFRQVAVFDSAAAAVNQADIILIPKAVRSSYFVTYPLRVLLVIEWRVTDRTGEHTLWLTSIETEAGQQKFGRRGPQERKVFQEAFDNLSQKTLQAFQKSPEIKRLSLNKQ